MTDDDRSILAFEDAHPKHTGAKQLQIVETWGLSAPRYYQRVHALIKSPEAAPEFPMLAERIGRVGADRVRWRLRE
jgi:hypothetical protein